MRYVIYLLLLAFSLNVFAIPNDHMVGSTIKRGGRPSRSDLDELKRQGFKTIINLENNQAAIEKEMRYAKQLGFNYVLRETDTYGTPVDSEIEKILAVLGDPNQQPVFIHCMHGQDRTGMVIGIYRVLNNSWTQANAYQEMLDLGFHPRYTNLRNYFFEKTKGM